MARTSTPTYRFTRLELGNWRNFKAITIDLHRRAFLVGPNASGKSNLLDAFRFLRDVVSVGGGFQAAVNHRGGVSKLRALSARRDPDVAIRVAVGTDLEPAIWEYELAFGQDKHLGPIIRREWLREEGRDHFSRPDVADASDPERLTQTYLEQVNVNKDYRPLAEFLASVRYLHVVPQLIREPDRSIGRSHDPFGGDFLEQLASIPQTARKARLRRIRDALKVAVPQLAELEFTRDQRGTPHLRGKYEHWRPRGAWQTEEQFSDGTLRLMGLLWVILDGSGPLLLEEPELSLHPAVVRYMPSMFARAQRMSRRQILVSTHSAELLSDEGIGLDEVFLFLPSDEGTSVQPCSDNAEVRALLEGGVSLPDAVLPRTQPADVLQLALIDL